MKGENCPLTPASVPRQGLVGRGPRAVSRLPWGGLPLVSAPQKRYSSYSESVQHWLNRDF
jgi:hypothetical protein